ncbi:DEAD/DEAH box helicase [Rapidithrix thailandica]|uniref:DEAD/DEAH box helicase n=1 Tax=Rapidithrix thailandica TaxID=413964 RepID=A0AAW9SG54_9BACT
MAEVQQGFDQFKINKQLINAIQDMGFQTPTPIQVKAVPLALAGHDLLGIAQTGTGKTAAFLLPIIMRIKYAQGQHPRCLIMTPTRELAMQINEHLASLAKYTDIRHTAVYGGVGPTKQIEAIQEGIDILVGTPGRIMDIYHRGELILKDIKIMVLDEADRMMDMGFMPQINSILEVIPSKRQNMLFSATMPEQVLRLSEDFLEFPERVEVTPQATTSEMVEQGLYYTPNLGVKNNLLLKLLENEEEFYRVLIFTRTKGNANNLYKFLSRKAKGEIRVIHANKAQNTRINAIEAFKAGEVRVLVATDVAARGIDISMVSHVINFDVPFMHADYVHRIGRTGRASNAGIAITFSNEAEKYHIQKIEQLIRSSIPVLEIPATVEIPETPFEERQDIARQIDLQKRKEDPTFQGAFHEKKKKKFTTSKKGGTGNKGKFSNHKKRKR